MSELLYSSQTFTDCVTGQCWYVKLPNVTVSYRMSAIFLQFWRILYKIDEYSCLKWSIFTKLPQIVCLINTHILICWNARCNYKLRKALWFDCFFWKFQCLIRHSSSNFLKICGKLVKIISTGHPAICNCILWMFVEHKSKPM